MDNLTNTILIASSTRGANVIKLMTFCHRMLVSQNAVLKMLTPTQKHLGDFSQSDSGLVNFVRGTVCEMFVPLQLLVCSV